MALSQNLVDLIERRADALARSFARDVKKHAGMPTYNGFEEAQLHERASLVYGQLVRWITREITREEIGSDFRALGARHAREGFRLSELVHALIILRRHVWLEVLSEGFLDTTLDMQQALDLNNRVVLFFDQALVHAALGHEGSD